MRRDALKFLLITLVRRWDRILLLKHLRGADAHGTRNFRWNIFSVLNLNSLIAAPFSIGNLPIESIYDEWGDQRFRLRSAI